MYKNAYGLDVLVNGRAVREYEKDGRSFIEGRINTQYSIRVRNNSFKRVLALVSVDGIGVISGSPASDKDSGYIIAPWSAVEIKGFRETQSTVGSFLFTNRAGSYAAGQGVPMNVGVIGVRIIDEAPQSLPTHISRETWESYLTVPTHTGALMNVSGYHPKGVMGNAGPVGLAGHWTNQVRSLSPEPTYSACVDTTSMVPQAQKFDVGTTWGKRVQDRVKTVEFKRGDVLEQLDIFYASRGSLEEMGISFVDETPISFPQSFPTYAKPPSGWRG